MVSYRAHCDYKLFVPAHLRLGFIVKIKTSFSEKVSTLENLARSDSDLLNIGNSIGPESCLTIDIDTKGWIFQIFRIRKSERIS